MCCSEIEEAAVEGFDGESAVKMVSWVVEIEEFLDMEGDDCRRGLVADLRGGISTIFGLPCRKYESVWAGAVSSGRLS